LEYSSNSDEEDANSWLKAEAARLWHAHLDVSPFLKADLHYHLFVAIIFKDELKCGLKKLSIRN